MNKNLLDDLCLIDVDTESALERLGGDKNIYYNILKAFLCDTSFYELGQALGDKNWDKAFTAAHALKGLAGNLGFTSLFHSIAELVILIRAGRLDEIDDSYKSAKKYYNELIEVISRNCNK